MRALVWRVRSECGSHLLLRGIKFIPPLSEKKWSNRKTTSCAAWGILLPAPEAVLSWGYEPVRHQTRWCPTLQPHGEDMPQDKGHPGVCAFLCVIIFLQRITGQNPGPTQQQMASPDGLVALWASQLGAMTGCRGSLTHSLLCPRSRVRVWARCELQRLQSEQPHFKTAGYSWFHFTYTLFLLSGPVSMRLMPKNETAKVRGWKLRSFMCSSHGKSRVK